MVRVLMVVMVLGWSAVLVGAEPLREAVAEIAAAWDRAMNEAAEAAEADLGATLQGDLEQPVEQADEDRPVLADEFRAYFDGLIAEGEAGGDALARAYLDAAAIVAEGGDLDAALEFFREADLWGERAGVRSRARFNFAQTRFLQARAEVMGGETDAAGPAGGGIQGAMQGMLQGVQNAAENGRQGPDFEVIKARLLDSANAFRAVLDVDPRDAEAARNVERVRRMIKAIEEQQQEQEQDQQQQQQGEDGEPQDSDQDQQDQGEQEQGDKGEGEQEGESESDRITDWLLDREAQQREQRDRQLKAIRGRPVPVERDW